ncbi:PTS transporter subunit EIIC, partial [Staphylococcus haemolyticus]|uniref:PTS transporter subunit EIIC n=1 Tax=Staphylococcus haemolyticus TaxID=1283 RepID=UPI0016434005
PFIPTKTLLTTFLSTFITVVHYGFFIKPNITIKIPKQLPPSISQLFNHIFPLSPLIIILYALHLILTSTPHTSLP